MRLSRELEDFENFDRLSEEIISFASLGIRPGLRRILRLLSILGSPERGIPAIHVLGTNGKGSTAVYLESIIRAGGKKTALYTSPDLISTQERLRLDGKFASAGDWREYWKIVSETVASDGELDSDRPTFFEHLTAVCLMMIREHKPDFCVMEAGMGGRYDATSVCDITATMINPIGMDHSQYLGSTIEAIAGEKFAAVKKGVHAFYAGDDESLVPLFAERCEINGAIPHILDASARPVDIRCSLSGTVFSLEALSDRENFSDGLTDLSTPLVGAHQASNATRVISLLLEMKKNSRDFSFVDPAVIRRGLAAADWPGRMEAISDPSGKTIILDGAHNAHAARALVSSLGSVRGEDGPLSVGAIVFAVMRDKDILSILRVLKGLNRPMYCSELPMERSCKAADLGNLARAEKITVAGTPRDPREALCAALGAVRGNEAVLCCGSLFLVGYLRKFLKYDL